MRNSITDASPAVMLAVPDLRNIVREEIRAVLAEQKINPYLNVKEAAKLATVAESTIRLYIRQGKLKSQKWGRRIVISRVELDRFLGMENTNLQRSRAT
jgi:excisionase family DNA binding protein